MRGAPGRIFRTTGTRVPFQARAGERAPGGTPGAFRVRPTEDTPGLLASPPATRPGYRAPDWRRTEADLTLDTSVDAWLAAGDFLTDWELLVA